MRILKSKPFLKICFIAYCALMLWLLFIRYRQIAITDYWSPLSGRINLIPLSSIGSMVRTLMENLRFDVLWVVIYNLGGNILMFVPLGFLLPSLWPRQRRFLRCMGTVALIMTAVELTQLFTLRGFCEIDDVILNVLGGAIGFCIRKATDIKSGEQ